MSGPKVVRIVTREERAATAVRDIARLDRAIARWKRRGERTGLIDQTAISEIERRRAAIDAQMAADEFSNVERTASALAVYLAGDLENRLERATTTEARRRGGRRQYAGIAASLIESLATADVAVPTGLKGALDAIRDGDPSATDHADATIASAFALLLPGNDRSGVTEQQRQIAERLGANETTQTLAGWLAGRPVDDDALGVQIDTHLARLELEFGHESVAPFLARARDIAAIAEPARRRLLADSLLIDLAAFSQQTRAQRERLDELEGLDAELTLIADAEATALREAVAETNLSSSAEGLDALIARIRAFVDAHAAEQAATARRAAVLGALTKLGYETIEGMATASVEDNRIVLRSAAGSARGVEISGDGAAGRLQFRAVAFGDPAAPRDRNHDAGLETEWCADFADAQKLVAEQGGSLEVERELPIGSSPVKVVAPIKLAERSRAAILPETAKHTRYT